MSIYKIIFCGTPEIAVPSLQSLVNDSRYEIVKVCTPPDKKIGRKQIITSCPLKQVAKDLNLSTQDIYQKKDLITLLQNTSIDICIVIAFGMIFPSKILNLPRYGTINIHFSLLPKWRGASPVQSSILAGETKSGITVQQMAKSLDSGDILEQQTFDITNKKTSEVFNCFAQETAQMLPLFLSKYLSGKISSKSQDKKEATFCHKFERSDGEVSFKEDTALEIYQKFLAFDLFPGIFFKTKKGDCKLLDISLAEEIDSVRIICKNQSILWISIAQLSGKKPIKMINILKGNPDLC